MPTLCPSPRLPGQLSRSSPQPLASRCSPSTRKLQMGTAWLSNRCPFPRASASAGVTSSPAPRLLHGQQPHLPRERLRRLRGCEGPRRHNTHGVGARENTRFYRAPRPAARSFPLLSMVSPSLGIHRSLSPAAGARPISTATSCRPQPGSIAVPSPWASLTASGAGGGSRAGRGSQGRGSQGSFPERGKAPGANLGIPKAASARPALVLPSPARSCCSGMSHRWKTNSI